MLQADWARLMWRYPIFKSRLVADTKLPTNWKISSAGVRGYSHCSSWWLRFWILITNLISPLFLGTPNPGKHQSQRLTSSGLSHLIAPMLHWPCNSLLSAAVFQRCGVWFVLNWSCMRFELQFNWLSDVFPSNSLKNSVVFDEDCKQLSALSISEACDLAHYILQIWFVAVIW